MLFSCFSNLLPLLCFLDHESYRDAELIIGAAGDRVLVHSVHGRIVRPLQTTSQLLRLASKSSPCSRKHISDCRALPSTATFQTPSDGLLHAAIRKLVTDLREEDGAATASARSLIVATRVSAGAEGRAHTRLRFPFQSRQQSVIALAWRIDCLLID